jgi:rubrerythrin
MALSNPFSKRRDRAVWADPERKLRTLESFAATEEDGGHDLAAAARRVSDPDLRLHLERHADDEVRHANLFKTRALAVRAQHHLADPDTKESDRPYDLSRGRHGVTQNAHGFLNAGLYDELGEVEYIAMLHVAEQRAAEMFQQQLDAVGDDAETAAVFKSILKDEKYHVAYTARFLERWEAEGREREVKQALRAARSSRALAAWKRLGVRSAGGFGRVVLWLLYWPLLAPFAFLARRKDLQSGWCEPAPRERALQGQG